MWCKNQIWQLTILTYWKVSHAYNLLALQINCPQFSPVMLQSYSVRRILRIQDILRLRSHRTNWTDWTVDRVFSSVTAMWTLLTEMPMTSGRRLHICRCSVNILCARGLPCSALYILLATNLKVNHSSMTNDSNSQVPQTKSNVQCSTVDKYANEVNRGLWLASVCCRIQELLLLWTKLDRTRLTKSKRVAMQGLKTRPRETFLRSLYVFARSAECDAVQLGVVRYRTHRLTVHDQNHIVDVTISALNLSSVSDTSSLL